MRSSISNAARVGAAGLAAVLLLSSCVSQTTAQNPKAVLGGVAGAGAGAGIAALAGAGTGWILGAAALGALFGGAIGHGLDQRDKQIAAQSAQQAFEYNRTGQGAQWQNPDSGNYGAITPTRTYQRGDGRYCREYTQEVFIDGQRHEAYGTACRQPDGSWQIIE